MDMGQCNDAYSAIKVAVALAEAFGCSVNELPLSIILSWDEQKAVCILLTLLYLGIKNIKLGPTLPAFVSPIIVTNPHLNCSLVILSLFIISSCIFAWYGIVRHTNSKIFHPHPLLHNTSPDRGRPLLLQIYQSNPSCDSTYLPNTGKSLV